MQSDEDVRGIFSQMSITNGDQIRHLGRVAKILRKEITGMDPVEKDSDVNFVVNGLSVTEFRSVTTHI